MHFRFAVIVFVISFFCTYSTMAQRDSYPKVTFQYSSIFDSPCTALTKQPIEPGSVKELESRLDSFQEQWRKEAPQLYRTTVKLSGVPFHFQETKAALSLCPDFPSMSIPLLINVRYFITAIHGERASPVTRFSFLVFHETLHRYVSDCIKALPNETTPLLTKYRDEPPAVRFHLHLIAIMNEVYRSLGREKDLADLIEFEHSSKYAALIRRTREIVDKEGSKNFIRELRKNR
ncbi:MAG: hypothetical protein ACR2IH_01105 [Pyrinomonadaceae bacterium]